VLEKPIGHDLASALRLGRTVHEVFEEPQVLRIDHYLGREAVQNILAFRFANSMVERAWGGETVDHVQITVAESVGVERRGRYYEEAGALRDMVQNHLLQVLSFVAMEPPDSLAPEDVRDRKAEVLEAVRPFSADVLVKGQYAAGVVEGQEVPGYRDEERVAPESTVETFVALRAWIDNARWKDVPFFLRTGRRLPRRATEVAIVLRESGGLFEGAGWRSTPCRWTSPTGTRSGPGRRSPMSASCTMRWRARRHYFCARTRSSAHGRSWLPCLMLPGPCTPTPRGPGAQASLTS
jgi:glucose-6-phosphate 1-dehydrogenase